MLARLAAWSVHIFTASGLIFAFLALLAIEQRDFRQAMIWLMVTLVIDGIDGTFARLFRVREVLPNVDGKTIDYVIDFFTYAILPAYFAYHALGIPAPWDFISVSVILLVSAVYYGKEGMVSADGRNFIGFPVMWNVVVFVQYFVLTTWPPAAHIAFILFFAVLHFVPVHFAYPSRSVRFRWLTWLVTLIVIGTMLWILWIYPRENNLARYLLLVGVLYFAGLAVIETWDAWRRPRSETE